MSPAEILSSSITARQKWDVVAIPLDHKFIERARSGRDGGDRASAHG